jgi:hypothetical protein
LLLPVTGANEASAPKRSVSQIWSRIFREGDCFVAPLLAMTGRGDVIASEAKQSPALNHPDFFEEQGFNVIVFVRGRTKVSEDHTVFCST